MKKSFIEEELEKLQEKGTWYKYYTKNKDLFLILQKAREKILKEITNQTNSTGFKIIIEKVLGK